MTYSTNIHLCLLAFKNKAPVLMEPTREVVRSLNNGYKTLDSHIPSPLLWRIDEFISTQTQRSSDYFVLYKWTPLPGF
jgi:hypothetical protein